jgi:hypothetical protein
MNLFRSEEHALGSDGYNEAMADALMPVSEWADIFSNPFFKQRGRPDYISWTSTDAGAAAFGELRSHLPVSKDT